MELRSSLLKDLRPRSSLSNVMEARSSLSNALRPRSGRTNALGPRPSLFNAPGPIERRGEGNSTRLDPDCCTVRVWALQTSETVRGPQPAT